MSAPECPRGCTSWEDCDEPEECSATSAPNPYPGERFGAGVCATGACIEPCGDHGGCSRGSRRVRRHVGMLGL